MSNNDSFIDEVTDEVRKDRLFALFRKYGWIGAVLIVAVVGGTAWTEWRKAQQAAAAESFGDALTAALAADDATRANALAAVAASAEQGPVLAMLRSADALAAKDPVGAAALLAPLAQDATLPVVYRHLALFKQVSIDPAMTPEARSAALTELTAPGAPFRTLGTEVQALDLIAAGKRDEALTMLRALADDAEATGALRQRVSQLIVALGGETAEG